MRKIKSIDVVHNVLVDPYSAWIPTTTTGWSSGARKLSDKSTSIDTSLFRRLAHFGVFFSQYRRTRRAKGRLCWSS
jgi:hypothetical protein